MEDLQESAKPWDLEFRQLDPGPFSGDLHIVVAPDVHVGHVRLDRRIEQAGTPPSGLRTLAVPAHARVRMFWRGRHVGGQEVLVYPVGSEIDVISQPGFEVYALSFSPETLQSAAEALGVPHLDRLLDASDAVEVDPRGLRHLRRDLAAWFQGGTSSGPRWGLDWTRRDLPRALVRLLAGSLAERRPPSVLLMDRAIRRIRERVAARPFDALRVGDLCRLIGVSERTLRHAFRTRLGMSPKAYLRDRRLNLVRRELRRGAASFAKIADVANRWGFWHMGQFAADYRRLFGERPSETIARGPTAVDGVEEDVGIAPAGGRG